MIIIELTYKKSLQEVDKHLEQHKDFLQKCYENGVLLASGPKNPRNGGVLIASASKEDIEKLIQDDPFYQEKIAEYRLIEFTPNRYHPSFEIIFNNIND